MTLADIISMSIDPDGQIHVGCKFYNLDKDEERLETITFGDYEFIQFIDEEEIKKIKKNIIKRLRKH